MLESFYEINYYYFNTWNIHN